MIDDASILISVVCYNNEDEVIAFAKQLAEQSICNNIQLIVTCNGSKRFEYLMGALSHFSFPTHVYNPERNLGYLQGCLYGVRKTKLPDQYWLMVCNTYLCFTSTNFFESVFDGVDSSVWCIGPNIKLKATGKSQNPFFFERPSKQSMLLRKIVYSNYMLYKVYCMFSDMKNKSWKEEIRHTSCFVYSVHGSCFLLKSDVIPLLIKESQNIFMYGEELLVSEIVRGQQKKVFFNCEASAIHNENQVTGTIATKRKQQWFKQSTDYIYSRFF